MGKSRDQDLANPNNSSPKFDDTTSTAQVDAIYKSDGQTKINQSSDGESYCIEVLRGPTKGDLIFLNDTKNTFGRDHDCTVMLDDITVSRHHCEIISKDGELVLTDTGSTNGTYVNSNPIDTCNIETGDVIQIGKFVFALARRTKQ